MNPARVRILVVATAMCAVVALVVAGISLWALATGGASGAGSASSSAEESDAGSGDSRLTRSVGSPGRTGEFSFGHTVQNAVPSPSAPLDAAMRLPFELGVDAAAFRVHVRNWQFDSEQLFDSPVTLTGIVVGEQLESGEAGLTGEFAGTPTRLSDTANLAEGEFVSPWIEPVTAELDAHTSYLLGIGWTAPAGARFGTTSALSWLATDGASGRIGDQGVLGEQAYLSYFDIWIEYTFSTDAPMLVSIGHSLNSPGNGDTAAFPTRGEKTSWPQQWALGNGAVAATLAAPGSQTTAFGPGAMKWEQYDGIEPDIVTVWAASNDIARGRSLADIQRDWGALVQKAHAEWPGAVIYAMTEPPRSLEQQPEEVRIAWNSWLATLPYGIDGLVDADRTLRDPFAPNRLRSDVDADGIHVNARGHALIAQLVPVPRG